jgi:hypothetical protein
MHCNRLLEGDAGDEAIVLGLLQRVQEGLARAA